MYLYLYIHTYIYNQTYISKELKDIKKNYKKYLLPPKRPTQETYTRDLHKKPTQVHYKKALQKRPTKENFCLQGDPQTFLVGLFDVYRYVNVNVIMR